MKNTWSPRVQLVVLIISILVPVLAYSASLLYQAAPPTIKWKKNSVQEITLTTNTTLSFQGGKVGERYTLVVLQDATGGRTITWPAEVQWPGGVTPALTPTPNSTDVFEFLFDGSRYLGSVTKDFKAPPSTSGLNAGLIHYWKLDEASGDAMDSVGGMTMTNQNSTQFVPGKINNGGDFELSNLNTLSSTNNLQGAPLAQYSACTWLKPESTPAANDSYVFFTSYDAPGMWDMRYINISGVPHLKINHFDNDGPIDITHPVTLSLGEWYFFCGVWDGSLIKMYLNGEQIGPSAPINTIRSIESNGTFIGSQSGLQQWDGLIDEVGVWDRSLSASEISELYNAGVGRQFPF